MTFRRAAFGGIVGPLAFVAAWVASGIAADDYSPVHDPISDLAAAGAPTRLTMTAGFIVFALGLAGYAYALRASLPGPAWASAAVTALATLGVAAFPLDHSSAVDTLHGVFATTGYVALAGTALLAVGPHARAGRRAWARAGLILGVATLVALAASVTTSADGLFQRVGLTIGDTWVVATALAIMRRDASRAG